MSKYYIYRQFSNFRSYHDYYLSSGRTYVEDPITGETTKSYDFYTPDSAWRYSLSKTEGEFYGAGNFCGYYGNSCWRGCELIADELFDVDSEGEISMMIVEYKKPVTYDVSDTYSNPKEVKFETDEEAIKYFVNYCTWEWENE